jgi:hypothetical protein
MGFQPSDRVLGIKYDSNGKSVHAGMNNEGNWQSVLASALGAAGVAPLAATAVGVLGLAGARQLERHLQNNPPKDFMDKLRYYRDAANKYPFETWSDEAQDDFVQTLDDYINKYRPGHTRYFGHSFEKGGQDDMNSRHREYKRYADERARLRTEPAYNKLNEIMGKNVNDWTEQDYQDAHTLINDLGHSKGKYHQFRRVRRDAELARHREKIAKEINPHRQEIYYRDWEKQVAQKREEMRREAQEKKLQESQRRREESETRAKLSAAEALKEYYQTQTPKKLQEDISATRQKARDAVKRIDEERLRQEAEKDFMKRQELKQKQYEARREFARSYDPIIINSTRQAMENSREQSEIEKEINRQRYYQNLWNWGK